MKKTDKTARMRKGEVVYVDNQIIRWQMKMKTFRRLKREITEMLIAHFDYDMEDLPKLNENIALWLKTPLKALGDAPPRQFLNPHNIRKLHKYVKVIGRVHSDE